MRYLDPAAFTKEQQAADITRGTRRDVATNEMLAAGIDAADVEATRIIKLQKAFGIVRFEDMPGGVSDLCSVRRSITAGIARVDAEIDYITISRYLNSGNKPHREQDARARLARRKAELEIPDEPVAPKPGDLAPEIARALETLAGDASKSLPKPEARLVTLAEKRDILDAGLRAVEERLGELRGEVSYGEALKLQKRHCALMVAQFRAAQAFTEASEAERSLRVAYTNAGYSPRYDVLPGGQLSAALVLGVESDFSSQISSFRRFLQDRGLLP
jgi:hypothetical protein